MQPVTSRATFAPPENVSNEDVDLARDVLALNFAAYKEFTIDRMNHQHNLIKNYLWFAASVFVAESAFLGHALNFPTGASVGLMLAACVLSCIVLAIGIDAMTGADFRAAMSDGRATVSYLLAPGGSSNQRTLAMIYQLIENAEAGLEEAGRTFDARVRKMRWMNRLLLLSLLFGFTAAGLFVITQL